MRKSLLLLTLLFLSHLILAQETQIQVIDIQTNNPVSFAKISDGVNKAIITDDTNLSLGYKTRVGDRASCLIPASLRERAVYSHRRGNRPKSLRYQDPQARQTTLESRSI